MRRIPPHRWFWAPLRHEPRLILAIKCVFCEVLIPPKAEYGDQACMECRKRDLKYWPE